MADSTTSKLNLSTESIQVVAEDAREVQITNQAAAEDGSRFMDPKLYVAAADGDIHVLEQYDIHAQLTPRKNTVLHVAAQFGQADCVEWILQPPSPSSLLQQPNEKGDTPLHLAAREGHLTVVKNLINAAKQLHGDTERGDTTVCEAMLRMINEDKDTALHEAVRHHHPKVVKLLIQEDPEFTYGANNEGNTPLYIAAEWGFKDLVHMILDNCSSPAHDGVNGRTALHAAVIVNDEAMTKKIWTWKPDLTKQLDANGWSPLHFAAYVGCDPTIVTQLLEKRDEYQYVVYLGVKYNGIEKRTALHIAASRGHGEIVKLLVSHFPDCCEKVDDKGNNVLHLIMQQKKILLTSGLSNIPWLWGRRLTHEKNDEGKTPFHLFDESIDDGTIIPSKMSSTWIWIRDTLTRPMRSSGVSMRPLGPLEIEEDSRSSESEESMEAAKAKKVKKHLKVSESEESEEILERKESKESKESESEIKNSMRSRINEMRNSMKSHLVVAALIATVTFAAGFTLPGGYVQNGSNNQGMAVLSLPTNGTKGTDRDMATAVRENFRNFVVADSIAFLLSMAAILFHFVGAFPYIDEYFAKATFSCGYIFTYAAMFAMTYAFCEALQAVLHPFSSLEHSINSIVTFVSYSLLFGIFLTIVHRPRRILYRKKYKHLMHL